MRDANKIVQAQTKLINHINELGEKLETYEQCFDDQARALCDYRYQSTKIQMCTSQIKMKKSIEFKRIIL